MKRQIFTHFLFLLFLFSAQQSHALSCVQPSFERDVSMADKIFHGRVIKVDGILTDDKINELTIIVDEPIKNTAKNEELTVYVRHWLEREDDWQESKNDIRQGIFALKEYKAKDLNLSMTFPDKVYFVGMCGSLYFPNTKENRDIANAYNEAKAQE